MAAAVKSKAALRVIHYAALGPRGPEPACNGSTPPRGFRAVTQDAGRVTCSRCRVWLRGCE